MPIAGEPHDRSSPDLTTSDGRKVKLVIPGLKPPPKPKAAETDESSEPPHDDLRPPVSPDEVGP